MRDNDELRAALDRACETGLLLGQLRVDAYHLCRRAEDGHVSQAEAAQEIHALISGLAIRARGIGEQCCAIADRLVRHLLGDRWRGITTPGASDRSNPRSEMVQLRFPAADFWSLAAIPHEIGHLLAREHDSAVRRVIDEGEPPQQREELFCDFYATFVLGPAYSGVMVLEELDPALARPARPFPDPDALSATHPAADKRVRMMLNTLAAMDETSDLDAPYRTARTRLADAWRERVGGGVDVADSTVGIGVDHLFKRLWRDVTKELGDPYLGSMASRTLADDLRTGRHSPPVSGLTVRDVIAAAWLARLESSADQGALAQIEQRAVAALSYAGGSERSAG